MVSWNRAILHGSNLGIHKESQCLPSLTFGTSTGLLPFTENKLFFEENNNSDAFIMLITFTYDWNCLYREFGPWDCLPKEENLVAILSWNIYSQRAVYILGNLAKILHDKKFQ